MSQHVYQVNYAELERFANEHDLNAEEIMQWATQDPDFAERYLATHGKINFGTYLKIKEFQASKLAAGSAFAERNAQTSTALRGVVATTSAVDETNSATMVSSTTSDPSRAGGAYVNIGPGEEPNTTLWRSGVPLFDGPPGQWSGADPVTGPSGESQ